MPVTEAKVVKEVEMKDAAVAESPKKELSPAEVQDVLLQDLRHHLASIRKSVSSGDSRILARVLRQTSVIRKKIWPQTLVRLVESAFPTDYANKPMLVQALKLLPAAGDVTMQDAAAPEAEAAKTLLPESEAFVHLLVLMVLLDRKLYAEAVSVSNALIQRIHAFNRRTLDLIAAKAYFYYARSYELSDKLGETRSVLLAAYRTAALRHDDLNQAVLLCLLLRNYLHYNLYEQAELLVAKTRFPESASNNQAARYLYYLGRIKAVQLSYSDAYRDLMQAARKAPQHAQALGFRLAVAKLQVIVELLMGDIPERSLFRTAGMERALRPYLQLTQAVRVGDLKMFQAALDQHGAVFRADKTYTLILRLRQNVIKTGLRTINAAYSCISFTDICNKLHLESAEVAEGTVAKAIADGVIQASIDHAGGFIRMQEPVDVYGTQQPAAAFHKRIGHCTDIAHQAIRAMSFPVDVKHEGAETADERRRRLAEEQELAEHIADDDLDDDAGDF